MPFNKFVKGLYFVTFHTNGILTDAIINKNSFLLSQPYQHCFQNLYIDSILIVELRTSTFLNNKLALTHIFDI